MVFERIIMVNGHSYKYLVMSVREGNKVKQKNIKYLGRADKPIEQADSPYGLYYFSQEGCDACQSESQVNHTLFWCQRVIKDETLPKLHYVNLTKDKNPLGIDIPYTPMAIEITHTKIFRDTDFYNNWILWRYGKEKGNAINKERQAAWSKNHTELIKLIEEGKTRSWLRKQGYNELDIRSASDEAGNEERYKKKQARKEARNKAWLQSNTQVNECKDGVCPLPEILQQG